MNGSEMTYHPLGEGNVQVVLRRFSPLYPDIHWRIITNFAKTLEIFKKLL